MIENELIRQLVEKIVRGYFPQKIILFGSYAYGNPTPESDIIVRLKNVGQSETFSLRRFSKKGMCFMDEAL